MKTRRMRENAHRLAYTLYNRSDDPITIKRLASILNYEPNQLQKDMEDLKQYILEMEQSEKEETR